MNYKKVTNLGKMYLLPKMHKRLNSVLVLLSNFLTPTEKISELLDKELRPQEGSSYKVCA